jgi:phage-related protein
MSIKIDGRPISDFKLKCELLHDHPALPSTRDYTVELSGRHGAYDYGADFGPRPFNLPMKLHGVRSNAELAAAITEFKKALLDSTGRPKTIKLSFDYEPDKWYMARYSGSLPIDRLVVMGKFILPLTAYDPAAYAAANAYDISRQYDTGLQYDAGLIYPNPPSFQWLYTRQYSSLYNHSYYKTPLKIIIKGSCTHPKITNIDTGTYIKITETLSANDELIIDAANFTVVKNKTVNLLSKYTGDFIQLVQGANGFSFESDSTPNATVTLEWNHLFL